MNNNFLPRLHPKVTYTQQIPLQQQQQEQREEREENEEYYQQSNSSPSSSSSSSSIFLKPYKIIKIKSKDKLKPYCYIKTKEYSKKINQINEINNSSSIYKDGYMTKYEREKMEENKIKSKFISGSFKNYSGIASTMPCRKEGLVRTSSKYLAPIQPHPKDKNTPLYGVWQPT